MDRPLLRVRDSLEEFLTAWNTAEYQRAAGLPPEPLEALPEAYAPETFAAATEALARAKERQDERVIRRLTLMREFLADRVEDAFAQEARDALAAEAQRPALAVDGQRLSFNQALAQLPREAHRPRRDVLERAAGSFLWGRKGRLQDLWEAPLKTAEALGWKSYPALREELAGFTVAPLQEEADEVLRRTEDAYRDVLGYVLRKVDPTLKPLPSGGARRHDLGAALLAPWTAGLFRRDDFGLALPRWLSEMGLADAAGRRIRMDDEPSSGRALAARVFPVRVPDNIRLVAPPRGGIDGLTQLLGAHGEALHFAFIDEALPAELRRLHDRSVPTAYALLFEQLAADGGWLRRYLHLPIVEARDATRLATFRMLAQLRLRSAMLGYEQSLLANGASDERAEQYTDAQRKALFVDPNASFSLHDVESRLSSGHALRAFGLAARLQTVLTARFNEDSWRNPAAGAWLRAQFARGGSLTADALASLVSGAPLSLREAGDRLVDELNA